MVSMKKINILALMGLFIAFLVTSVLAQDVMGENMDRQPAQIEQDREILEKAKARHYKGGGEEGELRVQAQLPKPQRKIAPVIDKKELEKETQEHD